MSIKIKIYLPEQSLPQEKADKVVLPVQEGTLTVIDGRAPSLQEITSGPIQLLDSQNRPGKRWFVDGGVANIAENECLIAVQQAVELNGLSLKEAEEKASGNPFYQKIYQYLKAFG